jgi:hypothetical protein
LVVGIPGGLPADLDVLQAAIKLLPPDAHWAMSCQVRDFLTMQRLMLIAFALGGHIRTGMEDHVEIRPGVLATSNAQFVEKWAAHAALWGRPVATAAQARELLFKEVACCPKLGDSRYSSTIARAPTGISGPKSWPSRLPTAIRCSSRRHRSSPTLCCTRHRAIAARLHTCHRVGKRAERCSRQFHRAREIEKELVDLARAKPDSLSYASSGAGSTQHLSAEMLKSLAKVDILHAPYKGSGQALTDLVGGQVSMMITAIPAAIPFIKSGQLRALAVASSSRSSSMMDVPTSTESGLPGFEVGNWVGLFAPAGTPQTVVDAIYRQTADILRSADFVSGLQKIGADPLPLSPTEFGAFIARELPRYERVTQSFGKLD